LAAKLSQPATFLAGMNFTEWLKLNSLQGAGSATLLAMTTKTIPAYLEDERKKVEDAQQRIDGEAARIQLLQHGHHRTPKQPTPELPSVVKAGSKARKTAAAAMNKPRTARKKATKSRKAA
jgi:hypothetical protein